MIQKNMRMIRIPNGPERMNPSTTLGTGRGANKRIESGISIRESQVKKWLTERGFRGEYLLVSTKPDSIYFKKLSALRTSQKLIVDLYTPIFLEKELTFSKWNPQDWLTRFRNKEMVRKFLRRGNHFLVANRRQREYWLKTAKNLGIPLKVNDTSVFPTGTPAIQNSEFRIQNFAIRNVVLWFGGIYPWTEPGPLIEAFSRMALRFPKWKLRFLGGFHPDTGYKNLYQKVKLMARSEISPEQLEIIPWQTEKEINSYLADVAVAVHLSKQTPEDYYAHRVRLLTLLNAGVGIITSGRDVISDLLVKKGAGFLVPDDGNLVDQLEKVIDQPEIIENWQKQAMFIQAQFIKQEEDIRWVL